MSKQFGLFWQHILSYSHEFSKKKKEATEQDTSENLEAGDMLSGIICNCFFMSLN